MGREGKDKEREAMGKEEGKKREGKERGSGEKPRKNAENRDFHQMFIFGGSCITHALRSIRAKFDFLA